MRIAILADIHGNLPAFEAALADVALQGADLIVIDGDIVVGAPDSGACWQLARSLGCPILRGNHERYVSRYGTPDASPLWSTEPFAPMRWAHRQLSEQDRSEMRALPLLLRIPEAPEVLFVHASTRSDSDTVAAYTPEAELETMFPGPLEPLIVRAHNHLASVRLWGEHTLVTTGSVGLAQDGMPTAQYLLLEQNQRRWAIRHRAVSYDLDAAIERFRETDYLTEAGPVGRLFLREVVTASPQLVPFMRLYGAWSENETIPLATAVERYLQLF